MRTLLPALFISLALPLTICSAEETNASEKPTPFTKLFKLSDFETEGNWMEEGKDVLHLKPREEKRAGSVTMPTFGFRNSIKILSAALTSNWVKAEIRDSTFAFPTSRTPLCTDSKSN